MQPRLLKYLLDIESVINEIEYVKIITKNNFDTFQSEVLLQRAVERDLEIIGEAIRKIFEIDPGIRITLAKNIIGLRNIISHAYDSVEPELIWGIIQNNIHYWQRRFKELKRCKSIKIKNSGITSLVLCLLLQLIRSFGWRSRCEISKLVHINNIIF